MGDYFHAASDWEVPAICLATHVWLPIDLNLQAKSMQVTWKDEWDLSVFEGR